jgi:hypothetical protein
MYSNKIGDTSNISILIDARINGYLFSPIIASLIKKGIRVIVYTPQSILKNVELDLPVSDLITYKELNPILNKNRFRYFIHLVGLYFLTREDFLFRSMKRYENSREEARPFKRVILGIAKLFPKLPDHKVNMTLSKMSTVFLENPFDSNTILVASQNSCPHLLGLKSQKVVTVMESWDHAVKKPNGYASDMVFAWNTSLGEDWTARQHDHLVHVFWPLKLRYARNTGVVREVSCDLIGERKFCVYCVTATRRFSPPLIVELEKKLIRDLSKATELAGWDLLIKPRPNGEFGEFDDVLKEFPNARIGSMQPQEADAPANYFLDDEYNARRFAEVSGAQFIINAFTTFGLDAAAANLPVLQIDIRGAIGYSASTFYYENDHIKKYLLTDKYVLKLTGNLVDGFTHYLSNPNDFPVKYSKALKRWLFTEESETEAIERLIEEVLGD